MDEKVSARGAVGQGPDLTGRVVVVTGAGGGQGLAETRLLAAAGAVVLAADLAPEPSPDLRQVIAEHGSALAYVRLDVTVPGDWAVLARSAEREFGRIDGLVNNAGTTRRPRLLEATPEDLAAVADVNVSGPLLGIQACVPLMGPGAKAATAGPSRSPTRCAESAPAQAGGPGTCSSGTHSS